MDQNMTARIAQEIGNRIGEGQRRGVPPPETVAQLQREFNERGLPVRIRWEDVLPGIGGVHLEIGGPVKPGDQPVTSEHVVDLVKEENCPGPHRDCPACKRQLCFKKMPSGAPIAPHGNCPLCGSFLVLSGEGPEQLQVALMTEQQVAELSDDERIQLQRGQRAVIMARR